MGVSSEDALVHACNRVDAEARGLFWATEQSLNMSLALVQAMLDEVQARLATLAVLRRGALRRRPEPRLEFVLEAAE